MSTHLAPAETVAIPRRPLSARTWEATHRFRPVLAVLTALFAVFAITQDGFVEWSNISNLLTGVAILWVVAVGMTFVLISGGFDLSVGSTMALAGLFLAAMLDLGLPAGIAVPLTVLFGGVVGAAVNGVLIGQLRLSFFVVTLASMIGITGVVNLWSGTETEFVDSALIERIGMGDVLGVATAIWIMAVTLAAALWIQHRTHLGRDIYAVGGSRTAARLAGIRTGRTLVVVYGISGLAAGLAGVIAVGRIGAASPQVDNVVALNAAAAVLLGGTSLMGGAGGVGGTALGVLFIGVLQNGLSTAGIDAFWQQIVTAAILVLAVLGDRAGDRGGAYRRLVRRISALRERRTAGATPSDDPAVRSAVTGGTPSVPVPDVPAGGPALTVNSSVRTPGEPAGPADSLPITVTEEVR